jgi:hypothetical protein
MRRPKAQPWYSDIRARLRFQGAALAEHPTLRVAAAGRGLKARVVYQLRLDVPDYETRSVTIRLRNGFVPYAAEISVDGPTESPHRYGEHRLCLWHPDDPEHERWVSTDGLAELITQIRIHLFKEAYWRETCVWLGPEAPHAPSAATERAA